MELETVIHRLSEHTINQIAAGEVIESPASVVKELVENAIDAGSTQIRVEIVQGGLQQIKVYDNGSGMNEKDALLCLERHATSKIREADDLGRVLTMGFRGEALASIAAISKMTLRTSLKGSTIGTEVVIEGGEILSIVPCARSQGTTVEVSSLFYNVPARKKFQKGAAACAGEITRTLSCLALAYPFISFSLSRGEGDQVFSFAAEQGSWTEALQGRIKHVLGAEFLEGATVVDAHFSSISCRGIVASFANTRPNRTLQYQFLNQRSVLCPTVSFAVKEAFGTRIAEGRFPLYVLHLDIPTDFLDINVHPQKKEVRLREDRFFQQELRSAIQEALVQKEGGEIFPSRAEEFCFTQSEPTFTREFFSPPLPTETKQEEAYLSSFVFERKPELIGLYSSYAWLDATSLSIPELLQEGAVLVDLRAAASRVLFDSLTRPSLEKADSQHLLIPLTLPCSLVEESLISAKLRELEDVGFLLESGRQCFLINAIPAALPESEVLDFIRQLLFQEKEKDLSSERKLATTCSRICFSRKEKHSIVTALALVTALLKSRSPLICPLGRKIIVPLGTEELDRLFSAGITKV